MSNKKLVIITSVAAILSAIFAFTAYLLLESNNASASTSTPVKLIGTWTGESSGISMVADITEGHIEISLNTGNGMSGDYWIGTFDTTERMSNDFTIVSKGDTKTMFTKLLASQDASKTFTYHNGALSYKFSMLGVSLIFHLVRSPQ